jgi:methionyl-tRNA formyltransferase
MSTPAKSLKLVFFGTPAFAVPAFRSLIESGYDVSAVFTGQGQVKVLAQEKGLQIFQPGSLKKDEQVFEAFTLLKPDLCVVVAYGKIIPARYLEIPKHGFVNIHPSLLPKYRGPSPIQTAIMNGDDRTGVSLMVVDAEVDHGPVIAKKEYEIPGNKYYRDIESELAALGANLLVQSLPGYIEGKIKPVPQDDKKATFTKMFEREDGRINWREPARKIHNKVRALNPEPGAWTAWQGKILNILKAEELRTNLDIKVKPGTVVSIQKSVAVKTETCYLNLISIQLEGGKEMDAKSFINGHPDFLNSVLE